MRTARPRERYVGIFAALLGASVLVAPIRGEKKQTETGAYRRYEAGPLRVEDFQGEPSEMTTSSGHRPMAFTSTRILFTCRYQLNTRGNRATARLKSIDIFAVIERNESWYEPAGGKALLDHEQGHFDITQASTLRARSRFREVLRRGRAPESTGKTNEEAGRQLSLSIKKLLLPFEQEAINAHQEYDRITGHGSLRRAQMEQRRIQTETLRRLTNELEEPSRREKSTSRKS